jgi:hypothetical protein
MANLLTLKPKSPKDAIGTTEGNTLDGFQSALGIKGHHHHYQVEVKVDVT